MILRAAPLWPHQAQAIARSRVLYREGHRAILLVSPTGSGKTRIGTHYVQAFHARGQHVLWLAHREELLAQAAARLLGDGVPAPDIAVVQADDRPTVSPVVVASVQTLVSHARRGVALPDADLVVFDEAHHYVAEEWGAVAARYAAALRVGLTATPVRADGTPLGDLFTALVDVASVRGLIDQGFLADFDVVGPGRPQDGLACSPLDALQQYPGGPAVVFLPSVQAARDLASGLDARGVRAAVVTGDTPDSERAAALRAFEAGTLDVLATCMVLTEGWDSTRVRRVVLARGCSAWATWRQIVGRGLRRDPVDPSKRCLLVDLRGVVHVHGMPDEPVVFTLDGAGYRRPGASDLPPLRQCPACWWIGAPPASRVCPRCARRLPAPPPPRITGETLRQVKATATRDEKQRAYDSLCRKARERGYAAGWVGFRFRGVYGHWPEGFVESPQGRAA